MTCEIYIQTSTQNPATQKTVRARWLIRSVSENGQETTRDGSVSLSNATTKQAALIALADALGRFTKPAVIRLYISDPFVRNMLITNMPTRWAANNWRKIRLNGQLHHEALWNKIHNDLKIHAVSYAREPDLINNKILNEMDWRMNNVRG